MTRPLIAALLLLAPAALRAGEATEASAMASSTEAAVEPSETSTPSNLKPSFELNGDTSYVGGARTNFGSGSTGTVTEERTDARAVLGVEENDGPIYRFGLAYQRYSFGFSKASPMPDELEGEYLVAGVDFEVLNSWLVRVEADPGFYDNGRDIGFRDFNVPFEIGGSYIASETLQWAVGLEVDINRQIPVFPAIGVRWAINDQWVLDAILPTPRLEYQWSKNLTLYLGGDLDDGTYRMDPGPGPARYTTTTTTVSQRKLAGYSIIPPNGPTPIYTTVTSTETKRTPVRNSPAAGSIVEYDEARIGAGLSWKAAKGVTLEMEGGYLPFREFDFHRSSVHFSNDDGAAYGQMSLNTQF